MPTPPAPDAAPRPRLDTLDGLRAVALLGMLAWHAEVGWVRGGFARMTIFFVLSGYLATRSFLALRTRAAGRGARRPGIAAVGPFWTRRARRLLPVTLLGLVVATVVTRVAGSADMVRDLPGDLVSVVAYVSNWRFLAVDRSYGALFERPSAFQHYWSLSLEEQAFLALPLVVGAVVAVGGRRWAPWATGALAAVLAAIPLLVAHSPDAAYYGTHVRGAEFLAGVTLALALDRRGGTLPARLEPVARQVGTAALAGLALVMVTVDRELPWLYRGGLALFALPAVAVVLAAQLPRGPVPRLLGVRPLAALGRAAFPVYVLHWPLFVLVRRQVGVLSGAVLVVAEVAGAVALGLVVHHLVERPLLAGAPRPGVRWRLTDGAVAGAAAAGLAVVVSVTVVAPPEPAGGGYDFAADESRVNAVPVAEDADTGWPAVAFFGGSTAVSLGAVAFDWAAGRPHLRIVPGSANLGCGLVTEGTRHTGIRVEGRPTRARPDDHCRDWEVRWPQVAADRGVRVAVVMGGVWETADWELDGTPGPTDITDPPFAALVRDKLTFALDALTADGRSALVATTPTVGPGESGRAREDRGIGADHERRVATYNEIVRDVASRNQSVAVLDYAAFVEALDPETSARWLPDGVHPTPSAAWTIWDELLGPAVAELLPAPAGGDAVPAGGDAVPAGGDAVPADEQPFRPEEGSTGPAEVAPDERAPVDGDPPAPA